MFKINIFNTQLPRLTHQADKKMGRQALMRHAVAEALRRMFTAFM